MEHDERDAYYDRDQGDGDGDGEGSASTTMRRPRQDGHGPQHLELERHSTWSDRNADGDGDVDVTNGSPSAPSADDAVAAAANHREARPYGVPDSMLGGSRRASACSDNSSGSGNDSSPGLNLSVDDIIGQLDLNRKVPAEAGAAAASSRASSASSGSGRRPSSDASHSTGGNIIKTQQLSPEEAPATAAADEAANKPVPSLSVEAIDGLIANADNRRAGNGDMKEPSNVAPAPVTLSCRRTQPQPQTSQQQQQHRAPTRSPPSSNPTSNPAAIVRSIASYLSLSDAESIGSLACTPYGTTIGIGTPAYSRRSRSLSVASAHSAQSSSGIRSATGSRRSRTQNQHPPQHQQSTGAPCSADADAEHDDADAAAGGTSSAGWTPAGILHLRHAARSESAGGGSVSWAGGDGLAPMSAPGLVSLGEEDGEDDDDDSDVDALPDEEDYDGITVNTYHEDDDEEVTIVKSPFDEESMRVFRRQQRKLIQQKLTEAVMSHPHSIRSYCLEAQRAATVMKEQRDNRRKQEEEAAAATEDGKEHMSALTKKKRLEKEQRGRILRVVLNTVLSNVPLSVLIDLAEATFDTSIDTSIAAVRVASMTMNGALSVLVSVVGWSFDAVTTLNPFVVVGTIFALQRDAAVHATDALVTGIQSVATGVGSASGTLSMHAINALSRAGAGHTSGASGGLGGGNAAKKVGSVVGIAEQAQFGSASRFLSRMNLLRGNNAATNNSTLSEKLYRRLSKVDSSSRVLSYIEKEDEVISQHARKRVQRMMHYHVSLRPFVATVNAPKDKASRKSTRSSFDNFDFPETMQTAPPSRQASNGTGAADGETNSVSSADDSEPFMCTPKSFPPTPTSRSNVMARGFRFSEDVVFLARDQLRLQGGLESENPQTRAMARALKEGSRLAVFNTGDAGSGVMLTCGQHVATKVGSDLYCGTRSMIPVLRNCYVYYEMSVSTSQSNPMMLQHASLSVGLSTLEMPLNALVGAWKGSIGLCSTGQILVAGQWCSPLDPRLSAYGTNCTVGCLVYLDDDSSFETWDGQMVTARVNFNVNGRVVNTQAQMTNSPLLGGNNNAWNGAGTIAAAVPPESPHNHQDGQQGEAVTPPQNVSTLPLFVPREEELYATLTLHSPDTQVLCRFCAEDILARSRGGIGCPEGVTVYTVDGSVLFCDDVNELDEYSNDENEEHGNESESCSDDDDLYDAHLKS